METDPTEKIDPTGPVAPYRQIANVVAARIRRGDYPPDTRIPTESELMAAFDVARTTARRAIKALREDGYVYTVPQRGSFVATKDQWPS